MIQKDGGGTSIAFLGHGSDFYPVEEAYKIDHHNWRTT